jgi:nucleoside-diphosphate-sugar epimerase
LALESDSTAGLALNLCEDRTFSMAMWSRMILEAAGSSAELVRVGDDVLPEDLKPTGTMTQHIACSARRARTVLGWSTSDPAETLRTSVRWHLANPPQESDLDFGADDHALGSV